MPTVRQFFTGIVNPAANPTAAYIIDASSRTGGRNKLYYYTGNYGAIPPGVLVHEWLTASGYTVRDSMMVNYSPTDWFNTYKEYESGWQLFHHSDLSLMVDPVLILPYLNRWDQFSLDKLGAEPNLGSIYNQVTNEADSFARRVYMLAAFCLLYYKGTLKTFGSSGHNIASVLVSEQGKILSWGVNDGAYRHAEVNTLIRYFQLNPTATKLPKRSVLFSTLKPCLMCSQFIKSVWNSPGETQVWYGMWDPGSSGSTDILGTFSQEFDRQDPLTEYIFPQPSPEAYLGFGENMVKGTGKVQITDGRGRGALSDKLNESLRFKGKGVSAADWVDSSRRVAQLFDAARLEFTSVQSSGSPVISKVKAVFDYLNDFIK